MNATKITDVELETASVASLPTRPTSPTAFGGRGYTPKEMKAAFDKLPLLLAERYNLLLEDVCALGEDSLAGAVPTGLSEEHTLSELFTDIKNGNLATYLTVGQKTLYSILDRLMKAVFGEGIDE